MLLLNIKYSTTTHTAAQNSHRMSHSSPFLMTSDAEVELGGPEVSLVSGLEWVGGLQTQEVVGALWDGRKLVGWEQFLKKQHKALRCIICVPGFSTTLVQHQKLCPHRARRQLQ